MISWNARMKERSVLRRKIRGGREMHYRRAAGTLGTFGSIGVLPLGGRGVHSTPEYAVERSSRPQ